LGKHWGDVDAECSWRGGKVAGADCRAGGEKKRLAR